MHALKLAVRAFCIIPFVTGVVDMINGVGLLIFAGAPLGNAASSPILNSQIGFWGAIWFGFGLILWRTSSNLRNEVGLFRLLCGIILLSGLTRAGSAIAYGLPGPELTGATTIELVAGVGFFLWHATALRSSGSAVAV